MKKILFNFCVMLFAAITVPIAVILYIPYALFKVLSDKDEFRAFYGDMIDLLVVPFVRYRIKMRKYDKTR